MARIVWKTAGSPKGTEHVWVISKDIGVVLASVMEWVMWGMGKKSTLTKLGVKLSCIQRYYNISKAKKRLGYRPLVSLQEGVERGVAWALEERRVASEKKGQ